MNRIYIHGLIQENFLSQLYTVLDRKKHVVIASELKKMSKDTNYPDFIDEYIAVDAKKKSFLQRFFGFLLSFFFKGEGLKQLIVGKPSQFRSILSMNYRAYSTALLLKRNNIDTIHIHFANAANVIIVFYLPNKIKSIVSFWGSDLLRESGVWDFFTRSKALSMVNTITIQTIQLREFLLVKFGRHIASNVTVNLFISPKNFFEKADAVSKVHIKQRDYITVMVGHNSHPSNQHLPILKNLSLLPLETRQKLKVVIPFSYGPRDTPYKKRILNFNSSFELQVLDNFLSFADLVELRLKMDIYIHLPISDALSGALTEQLYCGSKVITGSWLPYKLFDEIPTKIKYVSSIHEIRTAIVALIKELNEKGNDSDVRQRIRDIFLNEKIESKWRSILTT